MRRRLIRRRAPRRALTFFPRFRNLTATWAPVASSLNSFVTPAARWPGGRVEGWRRASWAGRAAEGVAAGVSAIRAWPLAKVARAEHSQVRVPFVGVCARHGASGARSAHALSSYTHYRPGYASSSMQAFNKAELSRELSPCGKNFLSTAQHGHAGSPAGLSGLDSEDGWETQRNTDNTVPSALCSVEAHSLKACLFAPRSLE